MKTKLLLETTHDADLVVDMLLSKDAIAADIEVNFCCRVTG